MLKFGLQIRLGSTRYKPTCNGRIQYAWRVIDPKMIQAPKIQLLYKSLTFFLLRPALRAKVLCNSLLCIEVR